MWSHITGRWRTPVRNTNGYLYINLCRAGVKEKHYVHRLVAQAFIPNPMNLPQINHLNGDKTDNRAENLEWCDNRHNNRHAYAVLGRKPTNQRPVLGIHVTSGVRLYMPSIREAARFVNGSNQHICHVCRGTRPTAYGYTWHYLDETNQINSLEIAA